MINIAHAYYIQFLDSTTQMEVWNNVILGPNIDDSIEYSAYYELKIQFMWNNVLQECHNKHSSSLSSTTKMVTIYK